MSIINILDNNTINQIAAGEVVEKPAAVVKELTENAIDAGSTAITVEVKNGGLDMMRITDNGKGIAGDDIRLAFERHATSKITGISDLASLSSLGFRGEALASIASVSRVECITKTPDSITGIRYVINGGNEEVYQEVGCPDGTTFVVRDIFYNTPARRKFLKTAATEGSYITDLVEKISLSHPEISFKYIYNGQIKVNTVGCGDQKDVIYRIYGRDITNNIVPVEYCANGINVRGYIGRPVIARGNRGLISCFVNGRYVKSPILFKAIEEGYSGYFMQHKFPFAVLMVELDQSRMDVNVHPSKQEVRFSEGDAVYSAVNTAVKNVLKMSMTVPEVPVPDAPAQKSHDQKDSTIVSKSAAAKTDSAYKSETTDNEATDNKKTLSGHGPEPFETARRASVMENITPYSEEPALQQSIFDSKGMEQEVLKDIRIAGCIFATYWIIEYHDEMYILDQHAGHEKVLYEEYSKSIKTGNIASQIIKPPVILTLTPAEAQTVNDNIELFNGLGYGIEYFGGNEYKINLVPADLPGIGGREALLDMISSLSEDNTLNTGNTLITEKIASMSCKAAVKGNRPISEAEAEALVRYLFTLDNPFNCPHGRPTMIKMTKREIEKKFGRIV